MSDANKQFVRRWFKEIWNDGRAESIDQLMASDGVIHGLADSPQGPAEFKQFHKNYRNAFPDVRVTLEALVAEGDLVAVRWVAECTHTGDGLGVPASGKHVRFTGMGMARIRDGKLVEGWNNLDQLGMFQQIGAVSFA